MFERFNADSFEQLVRAICISMLGPAATPFQRGPDGAREAYFKGKFSVTLLGPETWDGYGVVQIKYNKQPRGNSHDQAWAISQLHGELNQWEQSEDRKQKPQYYIFATNVNLPSASEERRKLERILDQRSGLKGYGIWDASHLRILIHEHAEVGARFSHYFTDGDPIAHYAAALRDLVEGTNPASLLTTCLERDLIADEDARLSQAGDRSEDRIRLANVFTDLPSAPNQIPISGDSTSGHPSPGSGSIRGLLRAASQKLDGTALRDKNYDPAKASGSSSFGRYVFVGGPGSGKSTIGQFLAQVNRAALLELVPIDKIESRVREIVGSIKARCTEDNLPWPSVPRYPIRIELNAFAKALSQSTGERIVTLSTYIRSHLSPNVTVSHQALLAWLGAYPWLLILDGLDEVPPSSNRRQVIEAIHAFLSEARHVNTDLMIVASSRPDGYANEFDSEDVEHRYLLPLKKETALAFGRRYIVAKSQNRYSASDSLSLLESAIENPLIERLMQSPLQVTFMVTVIAASGKPSESRWQLFSDYYRTIYERELHKAVPPFVNVLQDRRQEIDALHHRVGLLLQCRAESSGGTQADLSIDEFERLLTACLEENGAIDKEVEAQRSTIVEAARLRLIFLTSKSAGRLSFDVRSLQEFMAAASLTNADSEEVIERLEYVAHSAYWRNTILFAVGRFFSEPRMRQYREKIRLLCEDLNRKDAKVGAAKAGSRLALEILESGAITNVPHIGRSLANCGLELLGIPPASGNAPLRMGDQRTEIDYTNDESILFRLAHVYHPSMEPEYSSTIVPRLGHVDVDRELASWIVAMFLERRGVSWAARACNDWWPKTPDDGARILLAYLAAVERAGLSRGVPNVQISRRLDSLHKQISPDLYRRSFPKMMASGNLRDLWTWNWLSWPNTQLRIRVEVVVDGMPQGVSFEVLSCQFPVWEFVSDSEIVAETASMHREWRAVILVIQFLASPCAGSLADCLASLARDCEPNDWRLIANLTPWPLASCLACGDTKESLLRFAGFAKDGRLGDFEDWKSQEANWMSVGCDLAESLNTFGELGISVIGATTGITTSASELEESIAGARRMLDFLRGCASGPARSMLGWLLVCFASTRGALYYLSPVDLREIVLDSRQFWWIDNFIPYDETLPHFADDWYALFDALGRCPRLEYSESRRQPSDAVVAWLLEGYKADRSRLGLLRIIAYIVAPSKVKVPKGAVGEEILKISSPQLLAAAAVLLIAIRADEVSVQDLNGIAKLLPKALGEGSDSRERQLLLRCIEERSQAMPILEMLVPAVIDAISLDDWASRAKAESFRNMFVRAVPSGIGAVLVKCGITISDRG